VSRVQFSLCPIRRKPSRSPELRSLSTRGHSGQATPRKPIAYRIRSFCGRGSDVRLEDFARSRNTRRMGTKQNSKEATKKPPTCAAMLICDSVIRDEITRKTSVIGIFDTFCLESFPGQTTPCTIYLRLVDGIGRFAISAEVQDPARGIVLFRSPGAGACGSPSKETSEELWLPVAPLLFEQDGGYDIVLFADETELGRVQFKIKRSGP
jgi:hypothetical protein